MDNLYKKIKEYVTQYQMIQPGEELIVGVSGGMDSVFLFLFLIRLMKEIPFTMKVVHVNHQIRQEAEQDAEFVKKLCRDFEVPFVMESYPVEKLAKKEKCSTEEMGRILRYQAFYKHGNKIAVAHHMDDQAETVLFHMFRGTGLRGLAGIEPVNGSIIRPLLCVQKKEIEQALLEEGFSFCTDLTNEEDDYTRNRIRHHILEYAVKEVNGRTIEHICQMATDAVELQEYISKQAETALKNSQIPADTENELRISVLKLQKIYPYLKKEVIFLAIRKLTGLTKDIGREHIRQILLLADGQSGKCLSLPGGILVRREFNCLVFQMHSEKLPERREFCNGSFILTIRDNIGEIPTGRYTKWLDYDKITEPLQGRNRQEGDYLVIDTQGNKKTVKRYMIEEKIPKEDRDNWDLLAVGSHILWVAGYRISSDYKVTANTKQILQVTWQPDFSQEKGKCIWQNM